MDTRKPRREMLREIRDTEKELLRIYEQAAEELSAKAAKAKPGGLTRRWQLEMERSVRQRMKEIGSAVEGRITSASRTASNLPVKSMADWLDTVLRRTGRMGPDTSFKTILGRISDEALEQIIQGRAYLDGKSLSRRIWSRIGRQEEGINQLLTQAVAQKKSAEALAKELHAYLAPSVKDTPDASWYARRLARTSINHAYQLANNEASARNPFCTAMHWALSPQHFERQVRPFGTDICDEYAMHDEGLGVGNWPVRQTPLGHACCLCATYPVVPQSLEKCAEELRAWLDGAPNEKLEAAFGTWKAERGLQAYGTRGIMMADDRTAAKRARLLERIAQRQDVQSMGLLERQQYFSELENAGEDTLRELAGVRLHKDTIYFTDKQFGNKTREHAREWGLDPSKAEDRQRLRELFIEIAENADEIRIVDWRNKPAGSLAYIRGEDAALFEPDGKIITIMKDGANNQRVQRGETTDGWIW